MESTKLDSRTIHTWPSIVLVSNKISLHIAGQNVANHWHKNTKLFNTLLFNNRSVRCSDYVNRNIMLIKYPRLRIEQNLRSDFFGVSGSTSILLTNAELSRRGFHVVSRPLGMTEMPWVARQRVAYFLARLNSPIPFGCVALQSIPGEHSVFFDSTDLTVRLEGRLVNPVGVGPKLKVM